ncbi:hypothetical protein IW249_000364 [Micromonospora vinacea]|uniref:Uncharacterized protein n=1 Tax=Micromonospora vinacea TaxID=709878 RepID=A0ABS0JUA8_9ACTN|nr:hypothetical protein [Micromonospora vinacea]MBG6099950.1 hypothetical protein [Micromonospora vinacea]
MAYGFVALARPWLQDSDAAGRSTVTAMCGIVRNLLVSAATLAAEGAALGSTPVALDLASSNPRCPHHFRTVLRLSRMPATTPQQTGGSKSDCQYYSQQPPRR